MIYGERVGCMPTVAVFGSQLVELQLVRRCTSSSSHVSSGINPPLLHIAMGKAMNEPAVFSR